MTDFPSIVSIDIQSFKCFRELKLDFGDLTLVTGYNGAGKSSALQPLLLLAQAFQMEKKIENLPLNGPLVRLGTAGEITPIDSDYPTKFSLDFHNAGLKFEPILHAGDLVLSVTGVPSDIDPLIKNVLENLTYLGAVRMGPEDAYPLPERVGLINVGLDGRFAPFWYDKLRDNDVDERRMHKSEPSHTFKRQLDAWLGSLFPGAEVNVQNMASLSLMNLQFRLSELGEWRRPSNIGYGLTYVFPILVALLGALDGQVIIIDSPESHLHPSAQSQMGRMLAAFASAGVQIIVETHSDHLLNGVRMAVRENVVDPEQVQIHFFRGSKGIDHGVTSPKIGKSGDIYEWPDGFFDQTEKDLSVLAGWS